jgi:outer membrane immunogenic protein
MRTYKTFAVGVAALVAGYPATASAQTAAAPESPAFSGFYAGPEAGLHEHHFYLEESNPRTGTSEGRYYRGWGFGGGAFAGFDHAVSSRVRVGVEAGISVGGNSPEARFADGSFYVAKPRYGVRGTGKVGYLLSDRLMAYGTLGYGGHRYRVRTSGNIANAEEWGSSFTIGAGFEYQASDKIGVRLDFRHLDNQMSHLLVGIPIRF